MDDKQDRNDACTPYEATDARDSDGMKAGSEHSAVLDCSDEEWIPIYFTFDPIPDAFLRLSELPEPIVKILPEPHLQNGAEHTIR